MPTDERPASRDLITLRNWCRQQAGHTGADPLWAKLADEIDNYLHDDQDQPAQQGGLF